MSAEAWIDRLADGAIDPADAVPNLRGDLERLQRVAQRFERIGRPARRDRVALGALAERIAAYFEPRLPRHAHPVKITMDAPSAGPVINADSVLLEWALEALVRNALDALSGRGGSIDITVDDRDDWATIRVADDGPGIAPAVRPSVFEPGVTTKQGGWGIGLALARRIVEDVHGGRLNIAPSSAGTTFVVELPVAGAASDDD
jgi:signal transduction histidine kinase